MSKSLGNLVMVSDLLQTCSPDALRLYLGSHHYRAAWSYDEKDLRKFQALADRLKQAAQAEGGKDIAFVPTDFINDFTAAMENDLDTPRAVRALEKLANDILNAARTRQDVRDAQEILRRYGRVFGLTLAAGGPEERVISGWNAKKR